MAGINFKLHYIFTTEMLANRIIAAFFLLVFICSAFNQGVTTLAFYINQPYIAKNLCINQQTPALHCNGKCQLQKKINQEDNKDKQNPERRNESHNEVISSKTFFAQVSLPLNALLKKQYFVAGSGLPVDQPFQFFHPPQYLM